MDNILEVSQICKTFKNTEFALSDISFNLPRGVIMGLIGENGSGKTTTLNIILGLLKADSGGVKVFGNAFNMDDIKAKEKIGVVFDGNCFPGEFTPRDVSKIYANIYKKWDAAYFFQLLKTFDVDEKVVVRKMSHGTKATLAIITALAQKPELLVLDEPTGGIDPVRREDMLDLFLDFISNGQNSIIFSSHITGDIEKIADYVTFINRGKMLFSAEKDVFLYKYGIIRCGQEDFELLVKENKINILQYVKRDYQYRILVDDQSKIDAKLSESAVQENPTLEEIMYLIAKGEMGELL